MSIPGEGREQELAELLREVRALREVVDQLKVESRQPKLPPDYEVAVRTPQAYPPDYAVLVRPVIPRPEDPPVAEQ